jgi:hypothetical protein
MEKSARQENCDKESLVNLSTGFPTSDLSSAEMGLISRKDVAERNLCCPTISHLFQIMKKKLNFFVELCGQ